MRVALLGILLFFSSMVIAQIGFWPNGTQGDDHSTYAITNITLHTNAHTQVRDAALIFKDGIILAAGKANQVNLPDNVVLIDGKQAHIYPSFIDPYTQIGVQTAPDKIGESTSIYLPEDATSSAYNDAMNAHVRAVTSYVNNQEESKTYLEQGFGSAVTFNQEGIVRGTSALVGLGGGKMVNKIIKEDVALMLSFDKGNSKQAYPSSLMGSIAMLRQIYLDAQWYENTKPTHYRNLALDAFTRYKTLPTIIETKDKWDILRADKIGDEAGVQMIFLGSGNEYQRASEIKQTQGTVILPLAYPEALEVSDLLDAYKADVADLKHWELAPHNAAILAAQGVPFVFTLKGLKDKSTFLQQLRKLKDTGLSDVQILEALTSNTAQMLKVENQLGQLKKGFIANFFMASDDLFDAESMIYENWVQGEPYIINKLPAEDVRGDYKFTIQGKTYDLKIKGKITSPQALISLGEDKGHAKLIVSDYKLAIEIKLPQDSMQNFRLLFPLHNYKKVSGFAINQHGQKTPYNLSFVNDYHPDDKEKPEPKFQDIGKVWYPFNAFGTETLPFAQDYLIQNATIWTNTSQGTLEKTDVLVAHGKIKKIGTHISAPQATVIDGTGMYLTSGIIDEHTHIGIARGVNEIGSNNTAEVRIGDVINPDDVNFYRQLAGGVTLAQQLHGSANPIGGQSSVVKFKWGENAEGMKYKNAPKFIKFALGENVKQSNWGRSANRFPQSRPGVEQTMDFWFTRALEYEKEKISNKNYRKDLRLESTLEVVKHERLITCHSYVQSEINMFMNIAEKFGFTVNTFTHILEGYKVADKMKAHGANASTFSDWWAYKEEVREAIPYNASILNAVGVTTAINSDDAEMARRLNQEAAKTIKYGHTSPEEAWKMVTLNPAKIMHIDDKVGSIAVGKDADLVLWTDNPLSTYAIADKTFVDGILYYDAQKQPIKDQRVADEKNRIIQKMLFSDDMLQGHTQKVEEKEVLLYHCDTMNEVL